VVLLQSVVACGAEHGFLTSVEVPLDENQLALDGLQFSV